MSRPSHPGHPRRLPPDLAALEARLGRPPGDPPRHLRQRVLGAVIDALGESAETRRDLLPPERPERWREAIGALAALVALLLVAPWLGAGGTAPADAPPAVDRAGQRAAVAAARPPAPGSAGTHGDARVAPPPFTALALRTIPIHHLEQGDF